MKILQILPLLGCLLVIPGVAAAAEGDDPNISLSVGTEYTTGQYGGDVDIEDIYVPLTATVDYRRLTFRLTVPYLSVNAPEGTIISDPGGEPLPGGGELTTESGLGDIIGSVTLYDVISNRRLGLTMDLTGKVKFATADEDKGLGTGENDYTVQADFFKFAEQLTLLGSVGYRFRGDPTEYDLRDTLIASAGGIYNFAPDLKGGLIFDYRESSISGSDSVQELTGFVSRRLSENWRLQMFLLTGFTDSSPDWGGGFQFKRVL